MMLKQKVKDIDDCFKEIAIKSTVIKNYLNEHSIESWDYLNGWYACPINKEDYLKEECLRIINDRFPIKYAAILRTNSNRCYQWHVDDDRGVAVNMLLSNQQHSKCYFGRVSDESSDQYELFECPYKEETFYLFNTQAPHTVFNLDNYRYMFTLEFEATADTLSYSELRLWCENNNLVLN